MRLYPAISKEEALEWLLSQAAQVWKLEKTQELEKAAQPIAAAMAAVSTVVLPQEVEPLFP